MVIARTLSRNVSRALRPVCRSSGQPGNKLKVVRVLKGALPLSEFGLTVDSLLARSR